MELLEQLYQLTQNNLGYDLIYDIFKIVLGFIFARIIYEKWLMKFWWGGRKIIIKRNGKELAKRDLSPTVAKRIYTDETEFSIHVKGVVSPFSWLNKDISSKEAQDCGLVQRDSNTILIDLDKNEKKDKPKCECEPIVVDKLSKIEEQLETLMAIQTNENKNNDQNTLGDFSHKD